MNGGGLSLGPIVGGALFSIGGYQVPFYFGILMNFACFLMAFKFIPADID
jgi:MFS family permease